MGDRSVTLRLGRFHKPRHYFYATATAGCGGTVRTFIVQFQRLVTYCLVYPVKVEPSSGAAPESSRYECEVLLVETTTAVVRQLGTAPSSPAWKAEILLLNDWRI